MNKSVFVRLALLAGAIGIGCTAGSVTSPPLGMSDGSPSPGGTGAPYGGANTGATSGGGEGQGLNVDGGGSTGPKGPAPYFGTTTTLANSPPPISGGTLVALADGTHVVAADSDRDLVYVVDLSNNSVLPVALNAGDEPGRVAEDAQGQVHVVLRRGGAIATIDVASRTIVARRSVCVSPRGITFDAARARLLVACETGEVIALPPAGTGAPTTLTTLASGLRDIVVVGDATAGPWIFVSRFRTAEVMQLSIDGATLVTTTRPTRLNDESTLAWRLLAPPPSAGVQGPIVVHQFSSLAPVSTNPGGYSAGQPPVPPGGGGVPVSISCSNSALITPAISQNGVPLLLGPTTLVLPVDMVATDTGFAVISAGNGHTSQLAKLFALQPGACGLNATQYFFDGQPTAITKLADGSLMVQSREPATLTTFKPTMRAAQPPYVVEPLIISLSSAVSVEDTGHAIFHSNSGAGIACASCHGEGADDSHVWSFDTLGARRTPSLRGTINGTAPYHWDGTMTDIGMLADEVMTGRMNGPQLATDQKAALQSWLFAIPSPPLTTTGDAALIAQGQALFNSPSVGCSGCHSGPRFTNNATVNVGTGGSFQVPPLIGVRARAPYLHNGCALTLRDRFGICATPQHGNISQLSSSDIDALVAYLGSI